MLISLHKQATTTPKIRAAIQASTEPAWMVAERYGISEQTVWKWRSRDSVHDRGHTPHRLQTTLTPAQEAVAVVLRKTLLLPLDDLLSVVREFLNPNVSRSGLDRCLRRHGAGNLRDLKPAAPRPAHKPFKAYEPGYLHVDVKYLPQMADEEKRRYLFVAIDRATRWVFVRVYPAKTAANARRFLRDLERAAPMKITRVLTDNGKEFTDRLFGLRRRAATGNHDFDRLCIDLGIEHRLAPPMRPQTNGMVERFNGRIEDVLQSHRFRSGEDLEQTILRYVRLYNTQLPQSVLKGDTPTDALKDWHRRRPELFRKQPYNHAGCDSYRRIAAMLRDAGWAVNVKRVERIWRREGLKVPQKQPKKARLWLNDGSCIRLRPERPNHVWSYDFVESRTHDGRKFRMLNVIDEFTRECLSTRIDRKLNSTAVVDVLTDLFILRGVPGHVRSDNGPEFVAQAVRGWIDAVGAKTAFIEPGSPWENGYCESFNSKLRDELLNGEIFYSLVEARVVIEAWRVHYNTARPHSSLGYRPPAPEAVQWPSRDGGSPPPQATPLAPRPIMH